MQKTHNELQEKVGSSLPTVRIYHNTIPDNYPKHWHSGIEIIMPIEHDYKITTPNHTYHLKENDILFLNPGIIHSLESPPSGQRIIIRFDASLLYTFKELDTTLFILPPTLLVTSNNTPDIYPEIHSLINQIFLEHNEDFPLKDASIYNMLIRIYILLFRKELYERKKNQDVTLSKQDEYIEKIFYICEYINNNFTENISLEDAASVAGFSKYHFSRIFKQVTNMTFYTYLNKRRIMKAEMLLIDTKLSITDIAMSSGFGNLTTFNRVFKSIRKCSPSEYRKRYKQVLKNNYDLFPL